MSDKSVIVVTKRQRSEEEATRSCIRPHMSSQPHVMPVRCPSVGDLPGVAITCGRLVSQRERLVAIDRRMRQIMPGMAKAAQRSMIDSADRLGDMCNHGVAPGDDRS